jgi:hypothetical protein
VPEKIHLPSLGMLIISGLGIVFSLTAAVVLFLIGLLSFVSGKADMGMPFSFIALSWSAGLIALLALPSAIMSSLRLLGKPFPGLVLSRQVNNTSTLIIWAIAIISGALLSNVTAISWLVLPPFQILAIGIPIWWLVAFVGKGIQPLGSQSQWSLFGFSLLVNNPFILFIELVMLLILGIAVAILIYQQPGMAEQLTTTAQRLSGSNLDQETIRQVVADVAKNRVVVFSIFAVICGIGPLIEELFKTLGIWFLVRKNLSPAQGLLAGAICGAAFALLESLGVIVRPFDSLTWLVVILGRAGTGIMHILTGSLVGWGIASSVYYKKGFHLILAYLVSITLHGLWNLFSGLSGIGPFLESTSDGGNIVQILVKISPYILGIFMLVYLFMIAAINRRLNRSTI